MRWTRQHEDLLKKLYRTKSDKEIAKLFGVSAGAITNRRRRLHLRKPQHDKLIDWVRVDFSKPLVVLQKELNCSKSSILRASKRLRIIRGSSEEALNNSLTFPFLACWVIFSSLSKRQQSRLFRMLKKKYAQVHGKTL